MSLKEFFKSFFRIKKIDSLRRTLSFLIEKNEITEEELKKREKYNADFVIKIIKNTDYSKEIISKKSHKKYDVTNHSRLLEKIIDLDNLKKNELYSVAQMMLTYFTILIAVFALILSSTQFWGTFAIEKQKLNYIQLDHGVSLELTKFEQNIHSLDLCILNKGGVDSGEITLFIDESSLEFEKISPGNYSCFNINLYDVVNGSIPYLSEEDIKYDCLNCLLDFPENFK